MASHRSPRVERRDRSVLALVSFCAVTVAASCSPVADETRPGPPLDAWVPFMAIECDGDVAAVAEARVEAHEDGVHVQVTNSTGEPIQMAFAATPGPVTAPPGLSQYVIPAPPGEELSFSCGPGEAQGGAQVVDPAGYYVRGVLDCEEPAENFGSHVDLVEITGASEDPLPVIGSLPSGTIPGMRPGDELSRLGYPEGEPSFLRVLVGRGGRALQSHPVGDPGRSVALHGPRGELRPSLLGSARYSRRHMGRSGCSRRSTTELAAQQLLTRVAGTTPGRASA